MSMLKIYAKDAAFKLGTRLIALSAPAASLAAAPRRTSIDSRVIASIAFIPVDRTYGILEIEFVSGLIYQYDNVPGGLVDDLFEAHSKGAFFNQRIKPFYAARKIDG